MSLSVQDEILIETTVANEAKSTGLAYVLWFFFGWLGLHRIYLGYFASGLMMLAMPPAAIASIFLMPPLAVFFWTCQALWVLLDLFFIPSLASERREAIRQRLTASMLARGTLRPS